MHKQLPINASGRFFPYMRESIMLYTASEFPFCRFALTILKAYSGYTHFYLNIGFKDNWEKYFLDACISSKGILVCFYCALQTPYCLLLTPLR